MPSSKSKLSVRERLEAAIELHKFENPTSSLSISALSKLAGVSRSNIYSSHPDIAEKCRPAKDISAKKERTDSKKKLFQIRQELLVERKRNIALLFLVTEQREELQRLRTKLNRAETKSGRRQLKQAT